MQNIIFAMENSLTERTEDLYNSLYADGFDISFEVRKDLVESGRLEDGNWGMSPKFVIIAGNNDPAPSALAHELLHIHLFREGFRPAEFLVKKVHSGSFLFSEEFMSATNNNIAHFKMVGPFVRMGFHLNQFFGSGTEAQVDGLKAMVSEVVLLNHPDHFPNFINAYAVARLVNQFFSYDLAESMAALEQHDRQLFQICQLTFDEWIAADDADNLSFFMSLKARMQTAGE
ncbi:MAG: hypothetical protein EOO15_03745 [Chitinophagaceae bacterium]|nr:MAG: hypothetical protein EOO15_03745 [Chitinophagaceae bacterium]